MDSKVKIFLICAVLTSTLMQVTSLKCYVYRECKDDECIKKAKTTCNENTVINELLTTSHTPTDVTISTATLKNLTDTPKNASANPNTDPNNQDSTQLDNKKNNTEPKPGTIKFLRKRRETSGNGKQEISCPENNAEKCKTNHTASPTQANDTEQYVCVSYSFKDVNTYVKSGGCAVAYGMPDGKSCLGVAWRSNTTKEHKFTQCDTDYCNSATSIYLSIIFVPAILVHVFK